MAPGRSGAKAPRHPARLWQSVARGARQCRFGWLLSLAPTLTAGGLIAAPVAAEISAARYTEPTDRYPHGVLGDTIEHGALILTDSHLGSVTLRLPETRVFEDTAPRIADLDRDGVAEAVVVVESDAQWGARLAIYGATGMTAATPFIGTRFRWLAPAAIADLDGDGFTEIAYIDRPHLARTLRIWRYADGTLTALTQTPGLTNHRIGETDIAGGLRDCGSGPEIVLADVDWSNLVAARLVDNRIETRVIGPHKDRRDFAHALACD